MTDLEHVAAIYNEAAASGLPPLAAVAGRLGKSKATACRRVEAARLAGLIDSGLGDSGHINPKAMRVAQALGVSYRDLISAVVEHAAGDLRVGTVTRRG